MRTKAAVAAELSWPQVHAYRMRGHDLVAPPRRTVVQAAAHIGGAQAQVMSAAELQLAVRTGRAVTEVRDALWKSRTLVKTWLMRGTLHLVPAEDLPIYTAAMSGSWMQWRRSWLKYFGVTAGELNRLTSTIGAALNGEPKTREEVIAVAGKGQPERVRQYLKSGWGGFLKPVARSGRLVFGPSRGQAVTFVRPRDWLGSWREVEPVEALAEIARRYLRAFGPATRQDFVFWWGRWPGVGNAAWQALESELTTVSIEGTAAQVLTADLNRFPAATQDAVHLLPAFDPYLMGYASRDHLFDKAHRAKVSRTAGWISPVVLVDGLVAGTWTHAVAGATLRVEVTPFSRLARKVRTATAQKAESMARSLGLAKAELRVG